MKPRTKTYIKRLSWIIFVLFLLMNMVAGFHAYKFTHFDAGVKTKTKDAAKLSAGDKIKTLLFGIDNPRPQDKALPEWPYKTVIIKSNKNIECWYNTDLHSLGTVILFHGYSGDKSALLNEAGFFLSMGYNIMLVDFMGSGGSEGNQTTVGFFEAQEVKSAVDYVVANGGHNVILYGVSMGAAAIMKYINDGDNPVVHAVILECPFGTMLKTVQARFTEMNVPSFPMANLLVFWGGVQNGFNAFVNNPEQYAKRIKCPVLLMYGQKDAKVSRPEIDAIYANLPGHKKLKLFPLARHQDYLKLYPQDWMVEVKTFLKQRGTVSM